MRHLFFLLSLSSVCFFSRSEIFKDFSNCKQFFLDNTPPDFTPAVGVKVQHICQCLWDNAKKQIYLYTTLYSTAWRIPVYSAYVFGSPNIGRCDAWYIEPQLDKDDEPCMRPQGRGKTIGPNQALNSDYESSGYNKGHLYPVLHTNNHLSMLATSTLTNAAPQKADFNQKQWLEHEKAVAKDLESCDEAYVVTGVVPDMATNLNNRVIVSKYYWRATCCLENGQYTGTGYYGPDNNKKVEKLTIQELQDKLNDFYKMQSAIVTQIFPSIPNKNKQSKKAKTADPCN